MTLENESWAGGIEIKVTQNRKVVSLIFFNFNLAVISVTKWLEVLVIFCDKALVLLASVYP